MRIARQIFVLLRNTFLVTLAVVLGLTLADVMGLPIWLRVISLIPAAYLFQRLSGEPIPRMRRWVPEAVALSLFIVLMVVCTRLLQACFPAFPDFYWPAVIVFFVMFAPINWIMAWLERHWPSLENRRPPGPKEG